MVWKITGTPANFSSMTRVNHHDPQHSDSRIGKLTDLGPEQYQDFIKKLDKQYKMVKSQLIKHQSPTVGLFPSRMSEAPNEAHVRESIYCSVAMWALSLSYRKVDNDNGRTYELGQSVVKCMRGILYCWMRQSKNVEQFKRNQSEKNALHSKFHYLTGNTIEDSESLQIDCVGLYLLFLVQMISSGLEIIYTTDEVSFIQNLVYYVERSYRTPDYGMWQRGSKYNNGTVELHASSIGFSKAALEAINGFNLFGESGASWSVIYVDIDAHNRNMTIFETILPRESNSKNTDASHILTLSWPAFALHNEQICTKTLNKVKRKLQGNYGYKRFLRDGYKTMVEDKNRKYYRSAEIKNFDGIECEWPIFFIFLIIDGIFHGDMEQVSKYQKLLEPLLKHTNEGVIVPMYYYVPKEFVENERQNPGSHRRLPSDEGVNECYFLWGQAVYIISQLLVEGLLTINELDPIKRHLPACARPRKSSRYSTFQGTPNDLAVQICVIAESVRLQQMLSMYGILSQTPNQIEPIKIWSPNELTKAYEQLGISEKLGLTGRPSRPIGGLGTSKIYRAFGHLVVCYPLLFEVSDFYLSQDMNYVIDDVKNDIAFLARCWKLTGRPTFCMLIREENIRGPDTRNLLDLLAMIKSGSIDGVRVHLSRLQSIFSAACVENLDFLQSCDEDSEVKFHKFEELNVGSSSFKSLMEPWKKSTRLEIDECLDAKEFHSQPTVGLVQSLQSTENMHTQAQLLQILLSREGPNYKVDGHTMQEYLEKLLRKAGLHQHWSVVRFCASILGKLVDSLAPCFTSILVRGKQITIGIFGHEEEVIDKPVTPSEIKHILYDKCRIHNITEVCLQQEMILNVGKFISTSPTLFEGMLKIRIGWIIHAMQLELNASNEGMSIYQLSPSEVKRLFLSVIQMSSNGLSQSNPLARRQLDGALNRVPKDFYDNVWNILERTPGGLKVAGYLLPQHATLSDMTMYELNFSLLVEQMLSKIVDPAYRQLMVEAFMVVSKILSRNPELEYHQVMDMDKLIHEAFSEFQNDQNRLEGQEKQDNMLTFYKLPCFGQRGTASYLAKVALNNLLQGNIQCSSGEHCIIA